MLFVSFSDLSGCELMHVPDAVYHLMRNTELKTCDLSSNVIRKIPPKFSAKFSLLTGKVLNNIWLSHLNIQIYIMYSTRPKPRQQPADQTAGWA